VHARASQTGLEDCSASIVVINGALSLRDDIDARAVLAEAVRIVRPSGRVAVVDLVPIDDAEDRLEAVADVDVHVRSVARLRRLMTDAGMVMVGSVEGPAACEDAADLARGAGPRMGMKLARRRPMRGCVGLPRWCAGRRPRRPRLRAAAVVAERPLSMGWPATVNRARARGRRSDGPGVTTGEDARRWLDAAHDTYAHRVLAAACGLVVTGTATPRDAPPTDPAVTPAPVTPPPTTTPPPRRCPSR